MDDIRPEELSSVTEDSLSSMDLMTEELASLPGIGRKSAQRLAFYLLNQPEEKVKRFAASILNARAKVKECKLCHTLTDREICPICASKKRDHGTIMVVESTRDLQAYEKTGRYEGLYHVLHGALSPQKGIGPEDLRIRELFARLQTEDVQEVILATNSTTEGESTALYLSRLIKPVGIKVSRIASGVPVGGDLEYIDEVTLYKALEGRVTL